MNTVTIAVRHFSDAVRSGSDACMVWKINHVKYRACTRKHGRYKTYNEAQKAANQIYRKTGDKLYPYECTFCGGWHLTHELWEDDT